MIPAGHMNAIVTIQHNVPTQDSYGQDVENFVNLHVDQWCVWEEETGADVFISNQKASKQPVKVTIPYISGVNSTMRVVRDSLNYRIEGEPKTTGYRGLATPDEMVLSLIRFDSE